ncbi:MAG TPA: DUF971 domain-containing protein [Phycisphaerae bacterium]|nr:DUF971 domain-containing protein [Phycisphaerae bacterium]
MHAHDTSHALGTLPQDIKLNRAERRLTITWKDGVVSTYDTTDLRKNCPCASCNAERQQQSSTAELFPILKKDPGKGPPTAEGARLIGNYALHIQWSDGHDTGIYDFRYLRGLAEQQRK